MHHSCRDSSTRRRPAIAFSVSGLFWSIPTAIYRSTLEGGSLKVCLISLAIITTVCAPYWYYLFVHHEEDPIPIKITAARRVSTF
jgi:hypothetical protein